jgi:hypothetical protein
MMLADSISSLAIAMESEIAVFDAYVEGQKRFAGALRDRDWRGLQESMSLLEGISLRLSEIEGLRARAEAELRTETGCAEESFYRLALFVTEPERTRLTDLYRRLKVGAMRARFENETAGQYAEGSRNLLGSVLEELFPEKKGKIYGRSGRAVQSGHDALVLNTAL